MSISVSVVKKTIGAQKTFKKATVWDKIISKWTSVNVLSEHKSKIWFKMCFDFSNN